MKRLTHLVFLFLILGNLILFLTVYLYTESFYMKKEFAQKINESLPILTSPLHSISDTLKNYEIPIMWVIGAIFLIFTIYILFMLACYSWKNRHKKQETLNGRLFLSILILLCLTIGILVAMYYWPEDQIDCYLFKIQRGPPSQFLAQILDIGILVAGFHLLLFLLLMISHFARPGKKKKDKN
ncbi:MAG: hypothetical protein AABZ60_05635 [Planctomycetota bacterium]